MTVEAPLVVPA